MAFILAGGCLMLSAVLSDPWGSSWKAAVVYLSGFALLTAGCLG